MLLSFRGVDPCILHLEFVRSGELGGCATSVPFGKKELPREPMHLRGMCDMLATARATCRNAQPLDVQKLSRRKSNGRQENLCRFSGFVRAGGRSGWVGNGETIDFVPQRNSMDGPGKALLGQPPAEPGGGSGERNSALVPQAELRGPFRRAELGASCSESNCKSL